MTQQDQQPTTLELAVEHGRRAQAALDNLGVGAPAPDRPTPAKGYRGPAGSPIINKLIGCDVTIGFASGREYRGHLLTVDFQGWGRMVLDRGEPTSRVVIVNLRRAEVIE